MNLRNKSFILICSLAISLCYSCKKSQDSTPTAPSPVETVKLSIHLGGISTVETPMNGRKQGINTAARDLYDSTIYAVDIRNGSTPYAQGMFNRAGTITLQVPKNSTHTINVAVIKKGTSIGLYWGGVSGGYQYFFSPFNRRLMNELEYGDQVANSPWVLDPAFMASMSNITVRHDIISADEENYYYSELDSYFSTTTLTVGDTATAVDIPMKRISFGIQYQSTNFKEGMLIAEYDSLMKSQYFFPENISSSMHIYTANAFRFGDDLGDEKIHLTLKWQKNDGSIVTVGEKYLTPKRNSLTTINVTLPEPTIIKPLIELTDTTFAGNEDVYF